MQKPFFLIFLFFCLKNFGQNVYLKINGVSEKESFIIDSIGYKIKHDKIKLALEEVDLFSEKLLKLGYLESKIVETKKSNDTIFSYIYSLGEKTKFIHIYIGIENSSFFELKKDSIIIPITESESFLKNTLKKIEEKGYSLAKIKLSDVEKKKNYLSSNLTIELNEKRYINEIVINGYDKFPKGFKKSLMRFNKNKTFNQKNLDKITNEVNQYKFVKSTKYPEVLLTKDTTKVFIYVEKNKANLFDGFVGFSNDENQKVIFNGYLDVSLNNILNTGENFSLYWKSDGKEQKTFNLSIELPYIFKSQIGLKTQLNIFKQDSTFQTTKTNINLGYLFNYNNRLYLGYQSAESSDIQNLNTTSLNDYTNNFITSNYEYFVRKEETLFFTEKTYINLKIGNGKRNSKFENNSQFFTNLFLSHNFDLNNKNSINIKSDSYILQSSKYIINELYRFGGIKSIRGFNENSLQGNLFSSILTEYRYVLSPSIYIHSIIDYGYYQDKTSSTENNLLGLGFGFGIKNNNGIFNLIYANGSTKDQNIKLSNSIVHISFKANF
jgi:hypothetical protein